MDTRDAQKLALALMREHGVTDWSFQFDRAVRRFGCANYRTKTISLSRALTELNPESEVRSTILHEIAHVLAGPKAGHGPEWRRIARSIGDDGGRTHSAVMPEPPFQGTCPGCGKQVRKVRRNRSACSECCNAHNGGRWDARFMFEWVDTRQTTRVG